MKSFMKFLMSVIGVVMFLPATVFAEDKTSYQLDEIIVTAYKNNYLQMSSLNAETIQPDKSSTSDTASLLQDLPGISLYAAGGVSSLPSIYGLADDRIKIKVDGMDLVASCPNHMNSALSYVDPTNISKIKVYAGITPVSLGGDSIGGSIVAETTEPVFAASGQGNLFKGEAGVFYRSNGDANGGNLTSTFATESFNITYAGATAKSDNYDAGGDFKTFTATGRPGHSLPLDEVGSTAYKTWNHSLGLALKSDEHLIDAKLGYQRIPYELYPNQRMDMLENEQDSFNLHYLNRSGWGMLDARAYYEKVDHFMDFGEDKQYIYGAAPYVVAPGMPMYTKGKTTGATVKTEIVLNEGDFLRFGSEYQSYRLDDWWPPSPSDLTGMLFNATNPVPATFAGMAPDTFLNINNGERDRLGVFVEWEASWTQKWFLNMGARFDHVETDTGPVQGYNNSTSPMYVEGYRNSALAFNALDRKREDNNFDFSLVINNIPNENLVLEFGLAQKSRSPNLYERYSWSRNAMALIMNNYVGDGNGYLGNPDLEPEIARTASATVDWHSSEYDYELKITPFYTHVDDYIDAVQWNRTTNLPAPNTPGQFGILKFMNQSAKLYGADLSARMPLGVNILGKWGLKGIVKYTRGKNRDTDDNLYHIMPLNAKIILTQDVGGWANAVEFETVKEKDDISRARQELPSSGYSLVNLRASYTWKFLRLDFGVENLFDRLYSLPLGGACTGQGMTMSLNGIPFGISVPGMGRSIYTGLNVKF